MVELLFHGARDVDLIHQIDAAPQVETELQGTQSEIAHPVRHARGLRQRDREFIRARIGDQVARLQLVLSCWRNAA